MFTLDCLDRLGGEDFADPRSTGAEDYRRLLDESTYDGSRVR
jgi:hypothetical protein